MIVVRNIFRLDFGKSREAVAVWKEGLALARQSGMARKARLLTDFVGPFYTLILEIEFESLSDWEDHSKTLMGKPEWQSWYPKAAALAHDGYREIYNIVPLD